MVSELKTKEYTNVFKGDREIKTIQKMADAQVMRQAITQAATEAVNAAVQAMEVARGKASAGSRSETVRAGPN